MWLAQRPNVTAGRARAWYTHIMAESVKRQLRQFTGKVSLQAVQTNGTDLRLEHYLRIQTTLTNLVERHRQQKQNSAEEFIDTIIKYERVHIVTTKENYDAMRHQGNYKEAGIDLVSWNEISPERRTELWRKMLRGKVANANVYAC
jgi:CelD/BcsL family acetyltransferase involved in cellulose biosynthesis